jgi:DNA-binding CsgD family transcriptional regulator
MERLSQKELLAILGFLRGLYAADSEASFIRHIITELPKVLPSDITGYNEVDPLQVKISYVCDPADAPVPEPWIFEQHMKDHPVIKYHQKTKDGQAMKISDFLNRKEYHRLGLYNEFYRRVDVEYQMAIVLSPSPSQMIGIAVNRSRRDFSERERLMFNFIRPHLVQAYYNVEAATQMGQELTHARRAMEFAGVGAIVLKGENTRFITFRARQMLKSYFPNSSARSGEIPESLQRWLTQQLAMLNKEDNLPPPIKPLVVEREGRRLVIRLLAEPNQNLLILNEQRTASQPKDLEPLGLSPREAEVLYWIAQGKTNEETGSILTASTRTVGKHLERIYQKLGVETRTAAAILALTFLT